MPEPFVSELIGAGIFIIAVYVTIGVVHENAPPEKVNYFLSQLFEEKK